jgi:hypothetical protein
VGRVPVAGPLAAALRLVVGVRSIVLAACLQVYLLGTLVPDLRSRQKLMVLSFGRRK